MKIVEHYLQSISWDQIIITCIRILLILALSWAIMFLIKKFLRRLEHHLLKRGSTEGEPPTESAKRVDTLIRLIRQATLIALWVTVGLIILREIGVDIGPILASAGILGLAVGFGAQNLVRDVVSGFFILLENQIGVGDVAVINGTGGLVEEVNIRTIVLRDAAGTVHVFPNGTISTLSNMTKDWSAMVFDIGVAYKEDTDRVSKIMIEVAEELRADGEFKDRILEPMELMGVDSFGDSAVVIKARLKTKPIQQWAVGREYRRRLKKAFDEKGVEIPFPYRTITWADSSGPIQALVENKTGS